MNAASTSPAVGFAIRINSTGVHGEKRTRKDVFRI